MGANNIFDTRNILKETPKIGNRFLLTAQSDQLSDIIFGKEAETIDGKTTPGTPKSKIYKLNTLAGNDDVAFRGTATGKPSDVLNLSLLSATIPAFEFETGDINHFNDGVKHLTKFSANNDMSTAFYDYINGSATTIMLAWQSMVGFKLTGEMGYKEDYVCDMDLYVFGPNRPGISETNIQDEALMQYKILNAWPRSVDVGEFSYDNAEIKRVQVQFAYDMIIPVMVRSEALAGNGLKPVSLSSTDTQAEQDAAKTKLSSVTENDALYSLRV